MRSLYHWRTTNALPTPPLPETIEAKIWNWVAPLMSLWYATVNWDAVPLPATTGFASV